MAKLSQSQAREIAELVNSVMVDGDMAQMFLKQGNIPRHRRWHDLQCKSIVELADRFGIELPNLQRSREYLKETKLAA